MSFIAISVSPFGLMTEYVKFSFRPFEDDRVVSSLSEFLSHADLQYEFKGFEHVVPVIAKEVAVGLKFLHENGIAHRDLKPANILLSNDHYIHMCGDELEFMYMWENIPVVCKLADFGGGGGDAILGASGNKNSLGTRLNDIPQIATEMIISYPLELNKIRDLSSLYTVLDANKLMRDHNHLKNEFEFTEELPYADGVLAEVSRDQLQQ